MDPFKKYKNMKVVATFVFAFMLISGSASADEIRNGKYQIVGFIDRRSDGAFVRDCKNRQLGYTIPKVGTFRSNGSKISSQEIPEALLSDTPGCPTFNGR
jgi:hypothetical protein